ncbi:ASCH domain-containing protein [Agrobacterium rubi]|nr:ASCH domain-containing protein [Agrobacterium rubi]NTF25204.1 ASCH domain-containing protein [Agrobacterium rubi]
MKPDRDILVTPQPRIEQLTRCLLVKDPHATSILTGRKLWEIRGSATRIRGRVGIAKSGTGMIFGSVEVVGSREVCLDELLTSPNLPPDEHEMFARIGQVYTRPHAWILKDAVLFDTPARYTHPQGAVIWVDLKKASEQ